MDKVGRQTTKKTFVISNGENPTSSKKRRRFCEISGEVDISKSGDEAVSPKGDSGVIVQEESISIDDEEDFIAPKYKNGERIYVCESDEVYLATIRQSKFPASQWKYLVHFHGWNARHDRWMNEDCIMPDNDEARQMANKSRSKAAELEKKRKEKKNRLEKERKERKERKQGNGCNSKINPQKADEGSVDKNRPFEDKCSLPLDLKQVLVEDQLQVTKLGKITSGYDKINFDTTPARMVHDLPSTINVERLLKHFAKSSVKKKQISNDGEPPSVTGDMTKNCNMYNSFALEMINLFNAMLPKYLLYSFEHAQYLKLCGNPNGSSDGERQVPSKIYGGEFLLRMLVRLPSIISTLQKAASFRRTDQYIFPALQWEGALDADGEYVGQLVSELILFLSKNKLKIFRGEYRGATVDEYTESEKLFSEKQASRRNKVKHK